MGCFCRLCLIVSPCTEVALALAAPAATQTAAFDRVNGTASAYRLVPRTHSGSVIPPQHHLPPCSSYRHRHPHFLPLHFHHRPCHLTRHLLYRPHRLSHHLHHRHRRLPPTLRPVFHCPRPGSLRRHPNSNSRAERTSWLLCNIHCWSKLGCSAISVLLSNNS